MDEVTRRQVVQGALAAGVGLLAANVESRAATPATGPATRATTRPTSTPTTQIDCCWLDSWPSETAAVGVTWGVPWARGQVKNGDPIRVEAGGKAIASQSWTTAYWPDGSVKWSAIALAPDAALAGAASMARPAPGAAANAAKPVAFVVSPGTPGATGQAVSAKKNGTTVDIDTGVIRCTVAANETYLIASVQRDGKEILKNGSLVALRQDSPGDDAGLGSVSREAFTGSVDDVVIEQAGPVRAVIKLTGTHREKPTPNMQGREWLPFVVRLYFYAGSDTIRFMHSFVWDGDESKDFLSGLGLRFDVPMRDEMHNRHVRLLGQDGGMFYEAVRTVTGLRRDPGAAARQAQVNGKATNVADWATSVSNNIERVPAWGDFTLTQLTSDGFQIKKRTKAGCGWIAAGAGQRSGGSGYVGGATGGGVSFGVRDFWQKHPAQLDIRNAATDTAQVTLWLVSPEAPAMDLRMYHDVMGMETYDKQNDGLNITYEDYEPGYGTPYGIARTSEFSLRIEAATPSRPSLAAFAALITTPPTLMAAPQRFLDTGVFGKQWTLSDRSTPKKKWIEDRLDGTLAQYLKEIDQRRWYGFWDYGDVMHSYDTDRHQWKYDVGGFAWDNSELSTDLWLWLSVLRSGRADVYRMAEAMCRHTGEVDVYHLGRFKGLGTRHGVQHWSDSSKQSRISTPIYRRIYYYLTADERTGDLLTEQMGTIEAEKKIVIGRKLKPGSPTLPLPAVEMPPAGGDVNLGGLNWGNAIIAWVTEAERTGDPAWHAKIIESMRGIGELQKGFFATAWSTNIDTGHITDKHGEGINLSHLMACFGLPELANELVDLYGEQAPKFADAWAQYGRLYNGNEEQRRKELGDFKAGTFKEASLKDTHSRVSAFAAVHDKNDALAARAWAELLGNRFTPDAPQPESKLLTGPDVLETLDEIPMGTNGAAQWGLAAILCLALIGDKLN